MTRDVTYRTHPLGRDIKISTDEDGFTDADTGEALDPTAVFLKIETPSHTVTTYEYGVGAMIVRDGVGKYHAIIDANEAGTWIYRWVSTGTGKTADQKRFEVEAGI